ncbi:hypothetical protein [Sphingobium sp. YC-XJ3]|uniref:hypothetical protein n=1 Tax=Sphingobium sp. YC-XJ3 TaxID=3024245 RepID=UPI00235F73CE|nr:hypothetical protein [Sphingobium sp. YC-XJ3]WDA37829.1 hypothetical protein PO876_06520 [Sphingobium sp. YC-XJ3]
MFGLITRKQHEAIIAKADRLIDDAAQHVSAEEFSGAKTLPHKVALAIKRLEDARSNAFRNRQMMLTLEAELAVWRQYGQLRDPATGRLIPKADTPASLKQFRNKGVA